MLNYEPCLKSGSGAAQRVYAETVFAEEYTIFPFNAVCLLGASYREWVNAQGSYRGSLLLRLCPSITQSDLISCILLYPQLSNVYGPVFFPFSRAPVAYCIISLEAQRLHAFSQAEVASLATCLPTPAFWILVSGFTSFPVS